MRLELRGIRKNFGTVMANDGIDLVVEAGTVHCLLGENGAGKSTLMNLLYGVYRPDAGEILLDGRRVEFTGCRDAIAAGIGMVHQHFTLVPTLTVAENVVLGAETIGRLRRLDRRAAAALVDDLAERYGLTVPADAVVGDLPVGLQQRVEILKALSREARLLILDEPTAVLTPQESDQLFAVIRQLRDSGRSVLFISHKLREVHQHAEAITVIRRGRVVGQAEPGTSEAELAALMVGRSVASALVKPSVQLGRPVLRVEHVTFAAADGRSVLADVDLTAHEGEILGIAGVQGNGQTELVDLLVGRRQPAAGTIWLGGQSLSGMSTRRILDSGVSFVPEDRHRDGLVGTCSIAENLILNRYHHPDFSRGMRLRRSRIRQHADTMVQTFDIRAPASSVPAGALSGGNAQKVVLARELSRYPRLLVAVEPTRGLDVGSVEFIHRQILDIRQRGAAVVLVSSDLDEIVALADRVAVLHRGRVVGTVSPGAGRDELGLLMAGATREAA